MSEWTWDDGPDWKQVRKDAGLPPGSEKALIEGYFHALKEPPEGSMWFTVDSLAAALMVLDIDWDQEPPTLAAAAIIQAAKEGERE